MWIPRSFRVDDDSVLHELIRRYSFGILFSQGRDGPCATHLPLMISPDRGPRGTIVGHMALANPHWRSFTETTTALVVFQGPHAYISPSWYEDQVTVPTWNYAVVHAYGNPILVNDRDRLKAIVAKQVEQYEGERSPRWEMARAEPVLHSELKGIIGFEIPVERLEGKLKLNQNRDRADRRGVVRALQNSDDPLERGIADLMRDQLGDEAFAKAQDAIKSRRHRRDE